MRILWLHQYFATPRGWGAVRTHAFARRFVQAGHAVDVVCCAGYDASLRPTGREPVVIDGVRAFVSGTSYRPHMGFLRRILSFLSFMGYALWFVVRRGGGYDVMIASSGPLTLAVPALIGRWFRGLPFVFEVIDVWPDSAIAAGVLKNPVLKALSFRLEALAYRYAAAIVTCSTGMTERVEKKLGMRSSLVREGGRGSSLVRECVSALVGEGSRRTEDGGRGSAGVRECVSSLVGEDGRGSAGGRECGSTFVGEDGRKTEVVTISNCCDLEQYALGGEGRRKTRGRLGVCDGQTVVLYTGAMGTSNAVDDLLTAIRGTRADDRIVWWIAGDGPRGAEIRAALAEGASNRFFGSLPKQELVELYLAADINVVTFMHAPLFYENSPNKFFDGIAAGLPAVFNRTTWLQPWLEAYGCGIVCASGDAGAEMARQLSVLTSDAERRGRMGQGSLRLAEEVFSRERLAAEYLRVLRRACEAKREK